MTDDLSTLIANGKPSAARPLLGLTVLVVEDSRFACDAVRLMCLRSGARIRRADCLRSARRHLGAYRPGAVIVDLGLPDGSGLDLIAEIAGLGAQAPVLLGTSGDPGGDAAAREAGATGFLAKPIESLATFQRSILAALPDAALPLPLSIGAADRVRPDPLALRDDLLHAANVLRPGPEGDRLDYVARFLSGIARSAHDAPLQAAADALAADHRAGRATRQPLCHVSGLLQDRLAARAPF